MPVAHCEVRVSGIDQLRSFLRQIAEKLRETQSTSVKIRVTDDLGLVVLTTDVASALRFSR